MKTLPTFLTGTLSSAGAQVSGAPVAVVVSLIIVWGAVALLQTVFPQDSADRVVVWRLLDRRFRRRHRKQRGPKGDP